MPTSALLCQLGSIHQELCSKETGELLEELGADTTLGEDLGRDFRRILNARQ